MLKEKNELLMLKDKITQKQKDLFQIIYELNINSYKDSRIKMKVAEIELLLEILDTKLFYYRELKTTFWN